MAGDWIKMNSNLDTNPKVIQVAGIVDLDEIHVVGCLHKIWSWADQHSLKGNALTVSVSFLDRLVRVSGFAEALRSVDWLEGEDSNISFPRFAEHNGQTAKQRASTAKRVANHKAKTNAPTVSEVLPPALPREEKRREEKITKKEERVAPDFGDPKIQAAWELWLQSRIEKRNEVKPTARKLQITKLKKLSKADALSMLNNSTENGYTGLFGPNDSKARSGGSRNNDNANGRADASDFEL